MIKLHWYALTKPHVVHRYYKIKERPVSIGSKFWAGQHTVSLTCPNKDVDREVYNAAHRVLHFQLEAMEFYTLMDIVEKMIEGTSVKLTWNTK